MMTEAILENFERQRANEKQGEFRRNLVQHLVNTNSTLTLGEVITIYHVTYSRVRPHRTIAHIARLLGDLEREGVVACEWEIDRESDVVRTVSLARIELHPQLSSGC